MKSHLKICDSSVCGCHRWVLASLALALSGSIALVAAEKAKKEPDLSKLPPAATQPGVTYAKDIKPLFEENCFKCHGEKKQKGKLRLDSLEAALKGGEDGAVIVPGQGTKSSLLINVAQAGDEDDFMPPPDKGKPLSKEQVALIRAWIDQGAK